MGTNYYMLTESCGSCGRANRRHVGKSSGGWRMLLRCYDDLYDDGPGPKPRTWAEWKTALIEADRVVDEYDRPVDPHQLIRNAELKSDQRPHGHGAHTDGPIDLIAGEFS